MIWIFSIMICFLRKQRFGFAKEAVQQKKPVLYNMQYVPSFMEQLSGTEQGRD